MILLGVDTCGVSGSIALGRVSERGIELVGQTEIAGGEFASRLVQGISDLLTASGIAVAELGGIAVVTGPGSFTGIRIGLSAVKAIAEVGKIPVVAVSRLALLASCAGTECSALDAHRGQFFCGVYGAGALAREMLLTAGEVNLMGGLPGRVAVCEEPVAQLLETLQGEPELVRIAAPLAGEALSFALPRWRAGEFADVALLDGYYLRGADAKTQAALASKVG